MQMINFSFSFVLSGKSIEWNPLSCTFEEIQFPDFTIIQDVNKLRQAVAAIGNWQGLCENLDVDYGIIDTLKYSTDQPDTKKSNCLQAYFDKGEAVWEEVILAIARYPLKKVGLAKTIAFNYLHEPNQEKILKMLQSCS